MPSGDQGTGSFQDALKELLSSTEPKTESETRAADTATTEMEEAAGRHGQAKIEGSSTSPDEIDVSHTQPAYEVEIIPPEAVASSTLVEGSRGRRGAGNKRDSSSSPEDSNLTLEGDIQVLVLPTVPLARISQFEQALKERQGLQWHGTLGRSKQGTTIFVRLDHPATVSSLFQGLMSVERAEVARAGKVWQVKLSLSEETPVPAPPVEIPPTSVIQPAPSAAPAQYEPRSSYVEPAMRATGASQADLEVSPVASLDALNRFEKLITSLLPGSRIVNVLSLDGVSTVLITLEGINRDTLARILSDRVADVHVELAENRIVARLPEKW